MSASPDDPGRMSEEEHFAWWATLSDEEKMVAHVPPGYQHLLLVIAYIKRVLVVCEMKAGERLYHLEWLNKQTDNNYISPEMLAIIEPMSDAEMAMMHEARSLDQKGSDAKSFEILTRWKVLNSFLALNPSILAAIKLRERQRVTEAKFVAAELSSSVVTSNGRLPAPLQ
jgi:hypothetical protein